MNTRIFLFPAFVMHYAGNESYILQKYDFDFPGLLQIVSQSSGCDITGFHIEKNNFLNSELENQLVTYALSCAFSDILKSKNIFPDICTGLSMGLYAAMYSAGIISLHDGALLITRVFKAVRNHVQGKEFAMLNIVGLSQNDIKTIIDKHQLACEPVIQNGTYSFIISGTRNDILKLHNESCIEGALHTRIFPVSIPYHSSFIKLTLEEKNAIVRDIVFCKPNATLLSSLHGNALKDTDMFNEITNNLNTRVNFQSILEQMNKNYHPVFYECGPGNSMSKIIRFLQGKFQIQTMSEI